MRYDFEILFNFFDDFTSSRGRKIVNLYVLCQNFLTTKKLRSQISRLSFKIRYFSLPSLREVSNIVTTENKTKKITAILRSCDESHPLIFSRDSLCWWFTTMLLSGLLLLTMRVERKKHTQHAHNANAMLSTKPRSMLVRCVDSSTS